MLTRIAVAGLNARQSQYLVDALRGQQVEIIPLPRRTARRVSVPKVDFIFIIRFVGHSWTDRAYREMPRDRVKFIIGGCVSGLVREIGKVLAGTHSASKPTPRGHYRAHNRLPFTAASTD